MALILLPLSIDAYERIKSVKIRAGLESLSDSDFFSQIFDEKVTEAIPMKEDVIEVKSEKEILNFNDFPVRHSSFTCTTCNQINSNKEELLSHIKDNHNVLADFSCNCGLKFDDLTSFVQHNVLCVSPYKNKTIEPKPNLNYQPRNMRQRVAKLKCSNCPRKFHTESTLYLHDCQNNGDSYTTSNSLGNESMNSKERNQTNNHLEMTVDQNVHLPQSEKQVKEPIPAKVKRRSLVKQKNTPAKRRKTIKVAPETMQKQSPSKVPESKHGRRMSDGENYSIPKSNIIKVNKNIEGYNAELQGPGVISIDNVKLMTFEQIEESIKKEMKANTSFDIQQLISERSSLTPIFSSPLKFTCHCSQVFMDCSLFTAHQSTCGKPSTSAAEFLNNNVKQAPLRVPISSNGTYDCPKCPKKFKSILSLRQHCDGLHRDTFKFVCKACKKGYKWCTSYHYHLSICTAELPQEP